MTEINLLPWRETRAKAIKKRMFFFILFGLLLVCSLFVITHHSINTSIRQQLARNQRLHQEIALLNRQIAEVKTIKATMASLLMRATTIHQLMKERLFLLQVLDAVVNLLPQGVSLRELKRHGGSILLKGDALSNSSLSLLMRQLQVQRWVKNLLITDIQQRKRKINSAPKVNEFELIISLDLKDKRDEGKFT